LKIESVSATTSTAVVAGRLMRDGVTRIPVPLASSVRTAAARSPQTGLRWMAPDRLPDAPCALPPCIGHSAPGSTLQSHNNSAPAIADAPR